MFGKIKQAVAAVLSTKNQNVHRASVDNAALRIWVRDVLNRFFAEDREFTAFDVTQAVRKEHPDYNISHPVIRQIVNNETMPPLINAGLYTVQLRGFSDTGPEANVYSPVVATPNYDPA